ncbi:MAG: PIN domain-containing protein [bacterium]|nr:PIN domain-containing protein [bacterium]
MKVVLDANIIISFLISPGENISYIKNAWKNDKFELIISDDIYNEIDFVIEKLVKKDNRYLNCAKDSKAKYLVTGDIRHLLLLLKFKYTKIISASDFVLILSALPSKLN